MQLLSMTEMVKSYVELIMVHVEEVTSQRKVLDDPESGVYEPIRFCVDFGQRVIIAWVPQQSVDTPMSSQAFNNTDVSQQLYSDNRRLQ